MTARIAARVPLTKEKPTAPSVGFVSLGCPKALVDSELIITQLRAEGYATSASYGGADLVIVNTCGFIDAAVKESLDAIGEALAEVFGELDERSLIARALQKKMRGTPKAMTRAENARLYQYLTRQGFSPAAIVDALRKLGGRAREE